MAAVSKYLAESNTLQKSQPHPANLPVISYTDSQQMRFTAQGLKAVPLCMAKTSGGLAIPRLLLCSLHDLGLNKSRDPAAGL
jgi:hypothetical protein